MDRQDPPSTIKEVGIHIGYMRDDIHALATEIRELKSGFATKEEVLALQKEAAKEHAALWAEIKNIKSIARWWVGMLIALITAVGGLIALFK